MIQYPIQRSEVLKGLIRDHLGTGSRIYHEDYFGKKAAIVWPSFDSHACGCVVGEQWYDIKYLEIQYKRGVSRLLYELDKSAVHLIDFFHEFTDVLMLHSVTTIYTDVNQSTFLDQWLDFCDKRGLRSLELHPAPLAKNPLSLLSTVADFDNSGDLRVEKTSETYKELEGIGKVDLAQPHTWPRLLCLCYALAGLQKFRPSTSTRPRYRGQFGPQSPQSWMLG